MVWAYPVIEDIAPGLTIVGTAHVSPMSVGEVEQAIRSRRPTHVLVELDAKRLQALEDPDAWLNTDILQVLKQRKQHLFLLQLYLANMQARLGSTAGAAPGAEMLKAVQVAREVGAQVVLIDRDIAITFRRVFGAMGIWARLRLSWRFLMEVMTPPEPGAPPPEEKLQRIMETRQDAISEMTDEFARFAPEAKTALIDERDDYMASYLAAYVAAPGAGAAGASAESVAPGPTGVAIVGAGHMEGIRRRLKDPHFSVSRSALEAPPPRRFPWVTVFNLAVTLGLFVGVTLLIDRHHGTQAIQYLGWWVALHMVLAGLGAALALGHPWAILVGALAAPIFSLLPVGIKSGWLAGFVQAKVRRPRVRDFAAIKKVETFAQFWSNGVVRVLTVTAMTILGSEVASLLFVAIIAWRLSH
ncbi:MAG: TraB family protein [Thermoplasmatota archaeon]